MLKVGIDGCQNQVNGNWDKNETIFLLSFVSTSRSQAQDVDKPSREKARRR